jgi:hypothetical protein
MNTEDGDGLLPTWMIWILATQWVSNNELGAIFYAVEKEYK